MKIRWTKQSVADEALKYNTKTEFNKGSKGAYGYAQARKMLSEICTHMKRPNSTWTNTKVVKEALKYTKRTDFSHKSSGAYKYAIHHNIIDEICSHMVETRWDDESVKDEALKYSSRTKFNRESKGAYCYAVKNGIISDITSHMVNGHTASDNDMVYIFKVKNEKWNDKPIYKIGVTSIRLGLSRIKQIEQVSGFTFTVVNTFKVVGGTARSLEKELHSYGEKPKLSTFIGHTEFRALTDNQLIKVLKTANTFENLQ